MKKSVFAVMGISLLVNVLFGTFVCASDTRDTTFTDISGHWAQKTIEKMAASGIVCGMGNNKFQPDLQIKRSQFLSLLHKVSDIKINYLKAPDITEVFKDVNNEDWYASNLYDLVMCGIVDGADKFRPDDPMTREEMAHYLVKAYEYKTSDTTQIKGNDVFKKFKDSGEADKVYGEDIGYAVHLNLINGRGDGFFKPKESCTRAEATVISERLIKAIAGKVTKKE